MPTLIKILGVMGAALLTLAGAKVWPDYAWTFGWVGGGAAMLFVIWVRETCES